MYFRHGIAEQRARGWSRLRRLKTTLPNFAHLHVQGCCLMGVNDADLSPNAGAEDARRAFEIEEPDRSDLAGAAKQPRIKRGAKLRFKCELLCIEILRCVDLVRSMCVNESAALSLPTAPCYNSCTCFFCGASCAGFVSCVNSTL
jgi:hypothetical protein